jgi:hypothetical protein
MQEVWRLLYTFCTMFRLLAEAFQVVCRSSASCVMCNCKPAGPLRPQTVGMLQQQHSHMQGGGLGEAVQTLH